MNKPIYIYYYDGIAFGSNFTFRRGGIWNQIWELFHPNHYRYWVAFEELADAMLFISRMDSSMRNQLIVELLR